MEQIFARVAAGQGSSGAGQRRVPFRIRLVTELVSLGATTISGGQPSRAEGLPRPASTLASESWRQHSPLKLPTARWSRTRAWIGVLCFRHRRKVARDNTVKYRWHTLQLLTARRNGPAYAGTHVVEVQERLDGKLVVCYQNQIVPTQEAPPRPGVLRDSERHSRSWQRHRGEPRCRHGHQRDRWSRARRTGSDDRDRPGTRRREIGPRIARVKPSTLRLNHPDRRRLVSEPVGKQCRGPSVEAFLFGQSPGNWAYPASPSESTLRLQVHLSIRTGSSLLILGHVESPSVHNNRPVGKWAIPPGLSIYPRAAPLGSSHHHCHPRCHTKLEVGAFSIIELDNYWLDTATTDIIAGPLP